MSHKGNDIYNEQRHEMMQEHKKKGIKKSIKKAKGGMVGELKRMIKEPKVDHYASFKKQHKIP